VQGKDLLLPNAPVEHSLGIRKVLDARLQLSLGVAGLFGVRLMPG
jgi:hypothetical protein